jgi:2-phosphosulfolactate phosphatase
MTTTVEVLLTPAELVGSAMSDLTDTTCVVFDVLRATSTIVTALHQGAKEIIVVSDIAEALTLRASAPDVLLAGERNGERIRAPQTSCIDFDLGNSPREFTAERIAGRTIAMTTTNGTLALRACAGAPLTFAGSILNLSATAGALVRERTRRLLLVCAGTGRGASYEDVIGAGALLEMLPGVGFDRTSDACAMAADLHARAGDDLSRAFSQSQNGRRLATSPELRPDIAYCAQRDIFQQAVRIRARRARLQPTP